MVKFSVYLNRLVFVKKAAAGKKSNVLINHYLLYGDFETILQAVILNIWSFLSYHIPLFLFRLNVR